ncbi:DNA/RNA nuclease SfsA [Alcanivorax sp. 1008]|uniref:DNA/RNA nuclease SfsA n=1 Tax=Alcanivorax sp. 1008 TaxID=2816853 RepID=UPI001E09B71E|nr:DNA/RNA nuclease SfsA [Alcanivorax sp. 1008]MCC1497880.1 DNA/RNA nuclease SfsA [Alcanivorax sp. 1008]
MKFDPPLQQGRLLRRYKRFMADVELADGSVITLHCPNTGSMKNCQPVGAAVLYSDSGNPARKYRHTLEAVQVAHGHWAGVNTARTNQLVAEAILEKRVPGLKRYTALRREVTFTDSRFDIVLDHAHGAHTYIEVKNVTLGPAEDEPDHGVIAFPDSVTERGQKHLLTLMEAVRQGHKAVLFFCVQHTGAKAMRPADEVDRKYGELLRKAAAGGVSIVAWKTQISPREFSLKEAVTVIL